MKYTMDNCEVYQGYFAAARLAQLLGHTAQYQLWIARSDAVRSAILGDLWMGSDSPPRYAVFKGQGASQYWDDYYPGGMANDFPLIYAHLPGDARVQTAWSATRAKFLPGHVPASGVGIFAAWAAHRAGDGASERAAFAQATAVIRQYKHTSDSGLALQFEAERRPVAVVVPSVTAVPVIDGQTAEPQWQPAGRLWFHRLGVMVGADNQETYDYPGNTIDPDGIPNCPLLTSGESFFWRCAAGIDT